MSSVVVEWGGQKGKVEGGYPRGNTAQRRLREASFFLTATVNRSVREALVQGL